MIYTYIRVYIYIYIDTDSDTYIQTSANWVFNESTDTWWGRGYQMVSSFPVAKVGELRVCIYRVGIEYRINLNVK